MNIFEGGRRIAKLTAALIVVGFVANFFTEYYPPVSVSYLIAGATKPPVRVEQCDADKASRVKEITSKSGDTVNAILCFKFKSWELDPVVGKYTKEKFDDWAASGKPKSPIEIAERVLNSQDYIDMNEATKTEVKAIVLDKYKVNLDDLDILYAASPSTYATIALDALFQIPKADEGYITRLVWLQKAQSAGIGLLQMLASLAGFWLFVWTVGWIVRGFKGIPQGKDRLE